MLPVIKSHGTAGNATGASISQGSITVAAGDLIVGAYFAGANAGNPGSQSFTDSQSNSYSNRLLDTEFANGYAAGLYTAIASAGSSTLSLTGSQSASGALNDLAYLILDGNTILSSTGYWDVGATSFNGGANVTVPTSGTTSSCAGGDELVIGIVFTGTASTITAGTGFTLDDAAAGGGTTNIGTEHKAQSGVTSGVAATFNLSPSAPVYCMVAVIRGSLPPPVSKRRPDPWDAARRWIAMR